MIRRKIAIVGDDLCGKTCLVVAYTRGQLPEDFVPTIYDNHVVDTEVDGKHVELELWDTSEKDEDNRLRPMAYPDSHVALICFSIDSPDSLRNAEDKWISEVAHFLPGVPVILVGCKIDLRCDPQTIEALSRAGRRPITLEEGTIVAQRIGAKRYFECSANTGEGVQEAFKYAAEAAVLGNKRPGRCTIL